MLMMIDVLIILAADIGAPECEVVLAQDAAGPSTKTCPTGAFCLGACVPPRDQVQSVLARKEVRGRKHIAPDRPPLLLKE